MRSGGRPCFIDIYTIPPLAELASLPRRAMFVEGAALVDRDSLLG